MGFALVYIKHIAEKFNIIYPATDCEHFNDVFTNQINTEHDNFILTEASKTYFFATNVSDDG